MRETSAEHCAICKCLLHRTAGTYGKQTPQGRSHATAHHYVAERFFGRSSNRPRTQTDRLFESCPWGVDGQSGVFCYECHEELLHNPVLLPADVDAFATLVANRGLSEGTKSDDRSLQAGRVKLLHEVIQAGLKNVSANATKDG